MCPPSNTRYANIHAISQYNCADQTWPVFHYVRPKKLYDVHLKGLIPKNLQYAAEQSTAPGPKTYVILFQTPLLGTLAMLYTFESISVPDREQMNSKNFARSPVLLGT